MRLFFYFFIFLFFYFFPNESPSRGCWINTGRSLSVFLPVALVYFFVLLFSSLLIAVTDIRSDAQFILVVEKDAAFMRLAEDRFFAFRQPNVNLLVMLLCLEMKKLNARQLQAKVLITAGV